jgi:hypothetical protein
VGEERSNFRGHSCQIGCSFFLLSSLQLAICRAEIRISLWFVDVSYFCFCLDGSLSSYRKRQPKFPKNFFERLCELLAHGAQGGGFRLEALFQRDVPRTILDVGRRFVVVVFRITDDERCMSECWNRNAHFPRRRLRPNYRRDGSRYDLASTPCAFRPLQCYLLGTLS